MSKLQKMLGLAVVTWLALPALAADHLVTPGQADARLRAAAQARQADLQGLERFLASPEAERGVRALGQSPNRVKHALRGLSNAELRDLAARAEALEQDPVAGLSSDVNQLLIIFLIVAIVILVLQAVD